MNDMFNEIVGYAVYSFIGSATLIEILPIKISPLAWIGKRLFKHFDDKIDDVNNRLIRLEKKETKSKRGKILDFAASLKEGKKYGLNSFRNIFKVIDDYHEDIENLGMKNGLIEAESEYIKKMYDRFSRDGLFLNYDE